MFQSKPSKSEIEDFKPPATMDEILEVKLHPVLNAINDHVEKIYRDFNMSMHKQHLETVRVERDVSQMTKVMWGLLNATLVRLTALEKVLIKNGLDQSELTSAVMDVDQELKKSGDWKSTTLNEAAKEVGINLESALKTNQLSNVDGSLLTS